MIYSKAWAWRTGASRPTMRGCCASPCR